MTRVFSLGVLTALALALVPGAKASVTVGQLFTPGTDCSGGPATILQLSAHAGNGYAVPTPGVITEWSFDDGAAIVPGLELRVGRQVSGTDYKIVGTSVAGTQAPNTVSTYPAQIPVQAGDVIGEFETGGDCGSATGLPGDTFLSANGNQGLNSTATYTLESGSSSGRFPVSARLEPDADGDGFGDETQDLCPSDPSTHGPCPPPPPPPPPPSTIASVQFEANGPIRIDLARGTGALPVQCTNNPADECVIKLTLQATISARKSSLARKRTVKIGNASATVAGGQTGALAVKLNRAGRTLLKKHSPLRAKLVGTSSNRVGQLTPVKTTVSLAAASRKRH